MQEAQALVDQGLASSPQQPELIYWQAVLHIKSNHIDRAFSLLTGLAARGRALPPHLLLLGQIYEAREDWSQAAEIYRSLTTRGTFPRAQLGLGLSQFKLRDYDAAIRSLQPLAGENAPAEVFHLLGLAYLGKGELPSAARNLDQAVRKAPADARYHYDFGLALLQGQQLEPAASELRQAVELEPDWPEALLYLGQALHDLNRGDDAREAFRQAGKLDPDLPLLEYHLGLLEKGRGNFDLAMKHFEKELKRGSRYPACYYHLAELTGRRGHPERGRQLAEKAVELDPGNTKYRLLAAKMALEVNDLEAAEVHLEAALAGQPESGPAHYLHGRLLQAQGKPEAAARAFAKARRFSDRKSQRTGQP